MNKRVVTTVLCACLAVVGATPLADAHTSTAKDTTLAETSQPLEARCGSRPADIDRRPYATLFAYDGVNMRSGPSTTCTILGRGYLSNKLDYHCYDVGAEVNGYNTWTYLRNVTTGRYGWVNDSLLDVVDGIRGSLVRCD